MSAEKGFAVIVGARPNFAKAAFFMEASKYPEFFFTIALGSNKPFPSHEESGEAMLRHLWRRDFSSRHVPLWDSRVAERIFIGLCDEFL